MYIWTFVEHKEWLQMCSRCSWYPLDRKFENECLHCCLHSESDRSPHHRPGVLHHPGLQESAREDRHQQHRQHRPPHGSGHPDVQPQQCQERHWDINHRLQYYWLHVLLLISLHFSLDDNTGPGSRWARPRWRRRRKIYPINITILQHYNITILQYYPGLTLSRSRAPAPPGAGTQWRRFCLYSVVGWGAPLALTLALLVAQLSLSSQSVLQPNMGVEGCWLKKSTDTDLYLLVIPMSAILLLDTTIFCLIVSKLIITKLETRNVRLSTRQNQSHSRISTISVADLAEQMVFNKDVNGQTLGFTVLHCRLFMWRYSLLLEYYYWRNAFTYSLIKPKKITNPTLKYFLLFLTYSICREGLYFFLFLSVRRKFLSRSGNISIQETGRK